MKDLMSPPSQKGCCPGCHAEIEIPDDHAQAAISCPNCARKVAVRAAVDFRRESLRRNRKVWVAVMGLVALTLGLLGYRFRGHLSSGFGLVAEATGGSTTAVLSLTFALLALVCVFFWMIFPILVYLGLKDLRRRTAKLDQTTQRCVRHLAQLTAHQDVPQPEPKTEKESRGTVPP